MDIVVLIIQLLSGAVGGNIAGSLLKNYSLGTMWNSVVGILGGPYLFVRLGLAQVMESPADEARTEEPTSAL